MDAAVDIGKNPVKKHQIQPEYGDKQTDAGRDCRARRETKFSCANGDRELFIFPVQLTTSRIGNLTRLIHTLAICVTIHTYIIPMWIIPQQYLQQSCTWNSMLRTKY